MAFERLCHRLGSGRPLVLDADSGACMRARGLSLDLPGALGLLLRQRAHEVLAHHQAEVKSRVDVLTALTADTTPRALAEVGMQHRAAALTGLAVELAMDATLGFEKPIAVAGVLGSDMVGPIAAGRLDEEFAEHADRLRAAGAELIVARGQGSRSGLIAAVAAAGRTELPTWAVIECTDDDPETVATDSIQALANAGASAVLFEVASVDRGLVELERAREALHGAGLVPGVLLAAGPSAVRGFEHPDSDPERWVQRALELTEAGARIIGGGAGTTEAHTRALSLALGVLHPSAPPARSDAPLDRETSGC
ncbi:MAG TPA: homocysteine S-methyltransferase family protein [Polyangiaceae bacterium]|nr:homocysteine S-methyltransferase family protein [Polyangiaceae bacterium]